MNRPDPDCPAGGPGPVDLGALAPRRAFLDRLPAIGRQAADRPPEDPLLEAARSFVPVAAALAILAWIAGGSAIDASGAITLAAGAPDEQRAFVALGGVRVGEAP
jgi:hypothetical protein